MTKTKNYKKTLIACYLGFKPRGVIEPNSDEMKELDTVVEVLKSQGFFYIIKKEGCYPLLFSFRSFAFRQTNAGHPCVWFGLSFS